MQKAAAILTLFPAAKTASVVVISGIQYIGRVFLYLPPQPCLRGGKKKKKSSKKILMNFVPKKFKAKQPAYGVFIKWNNNTHGRACSATP